MVSSDGWFIAFQCGNAYEEAGVERGIDVMRLRPEGRLQPVGCVPHPIRRDRPLRQPREYSLSTFRCASSILLVPTTDLFFRRVSNQERKRREDFIMLGLMRMSLQGRNRRELLVSAGKVALAAALGGVTTLPEQVLAAASESLAGPMLRFARAEIAKAAEVAAVLAPPVSFSLDPSLGEQAYRIDRGPAGGYRVTGGDMPGAMYGGLDIAEALRLGPAALVRLMTPRLNRPFVSRRGIKYNIPLDLRTPSYSDNSSSAQANIPEVWDASFWRTFLDQLARDRYNMLSLWSLHPFPSMVKVPEFPDVALDDVWRTREPLGPTPLNQVGHGAVPARYLANHEVVKRITIEQKIAFWRDVMRMAAERGIEVYVFTWNVFTYGAEGKYGIDSSMSNPRTVAYMRASVREMVKTYPLLRGFGITAGENMFEAGGVTKEQWLWRTYGEGVRDALKSSPGRDVRLIHRFWQTSNSEIRGNWQDYPGWPATFSFSYKYSQAHMYSDVAPPFVRQIMPLLADGMKTWLTVRNDDVYAVRWGDPEYARQYVLNMPPADKLIGFYMGPDGFTWGRDFLDRASHGRDLGDARRLDIQKHWYSFMLWGRLSYDPTLPVALFEESFAARFPGVDAPRLLAATAAASRIIPQTSRFFWRTNDLEWLPEANARFFTAIMSMDELKLVTDRLAEDEALIASHRPEPAGREPATHFYTVTEFMNGVTMPGAGILNVRQWRDRMLKGLTMQIISPMDVADALTGHAAEALSLVGQLRASSSNTANAELRETLGDCEAMAHLGSYYAEKIRGACQLALFDASGAERDRSAAIAHLEQAGEAWRRYAAIRDAQYLPGFYCRIGWIDLTALATQAAEDVAIARAWRPGTLVFDPDSPDDQRIGMGYQEPVPVR